MSTTRDNTARSTREDRLDEVFTALADRTRRALVARLRRGPATIGELAEPFDMTLPGVSKHVRILERAGLVRRTVDGRVHHCALDAAPLAEADEWLAHYRVFWEESLESLAQYVEEGRTK